MDFLTLFAIYVVVVLTCIVLVCKYSGQQQTPFSIVFNCVGKVVSPLTPKWLQELSQRSLHRLFHQRNNMFIYLHVVLEAAVYAEFTYEVFGFCREMDTTLTSLSVPYVLLTFKSFFFYLCIRKDPESPEQPPLPGCQLEREPEEEQSTEKEKKLEEENNNNMKLSLKETEIERLKAQISTLKKKTLTPELLESSEISKMLEYSTGFTYDRFNQLYTIFGIPNDPHTTQINVPLNYKRND